MPRARNMPASVTMNGGKSKTWITAPIAAVIGTRATLVGAGLLGGAVTIAFLFLPGMRAMERRPEGPAGAPAAAEPPLAAVSGDAPGGS